MFVLLNIFVKLWNLYFNGSLHKDRKECEQRIWKFNPYLIRNNYPLEKNVFVSKGTFLFHIIELVLPLPYTCSFSYLSCFVFNHSLGRPLRFSKLTFLFPLCYLYTLHPRYLKFHICFDIYFPKQFCILLRNFPSNSFLKTFWNLIFL